MNQPFPPDYTYVLIGNDFAGLLPPDKEAEKADTWCAKSHSPELSLAWPDHFFSVTALID